MSRTFGSIDAFLAHLRKVEREIAPAQHRGLEAAGKGLVTGAQHMIGNGVAQWPELADSTVVEKTRLGYVGRLSATDPLYRTGELRVSISFVVEGHAVRFGSSDPIAPFQEDGTSRIPPRPFISATMHRDGHAATQMVAGYSMTVFGFKPPAPASNGSLAGA